MSTLPSAISPDGALCESATSPQAAWRVHARPWFLIVGLALAVALPVLLPPVLPLTDLGGHLGRYAIQLDGGRDPVLAQWYTFRWLLIPNLGVDLLVQGLGPLIGLEPAVRAIVFATAFLQAFGILAVSRVAHGRITPFAIVALPFVYAFSFLYGFLNYTLSLGLLWCSLALWIGMSEGAAIRRRWPVFALIATAVWACHLVGWALLCIAAGSQELMRQRDSKGALVPAAVASIGSLSCLLVPWLLRFLTFQPSTGSGRSEGFFLMIEKLVALLHVFADQWRLFDLFSLDGILAVIVWSWLSKSTRLDRGLALAAAITATCVIVVPQRALGSFFADQRLIEPTLVFALLAISFSARATSKLPRALFIAAVLFAGARLAGNAMSLWNFGQRSAEDLQVLEALPRHSELVTFRALDCRAPMEWPIDRRTHLSGYAIERRRAFSNDQWQLPGGQLLRVHNRAAGPFETDDSQIDFETPCHGKAGVIAQSERVPEAIPYLWVIWTGTPRPLKRWEPLASKGESVLYRRRTTG